MLKPVLTLPLLFSFALAGGAGQPAPAFMEVWEGTYTCAQGVTGARLNIREFDGQHFKLVGEMFPVGSNPSVPSGRAELQGTVQGDLRSGRLTLKSWRWLQQPVGYQLAPFSADYALSSDYRTIKLTMNPPLLGCTGGEFRRVK